MDFKKDVYRSMAMITQIGISMLAPIVLCVFIGVWIEDTWEFNIIIPMLILGILSGCRNCYLLLKDLIPKDGRTKEKENREDGDGK